MEVTCTGLVAGGAGIARDGDGRILFVRTALPGERVRVAITERRKDFSRADVMAVIDPSPDRVVPRCPHVADGCGGCDWQHVAVAAQPGLKVTIVVDALRRLGHIADAADLVVGGPPIAVDGFRTTVRAVVQSGRAGYRKVASNEPVAVRACLVAHPRLEAMLVAGAWGGAREVTLRIGAATGEALVVVDPDASGVRLTNLAEGLDEVVVVGLDEVRAGCDAWFHEIVAGVRFRVSAMSFFQTQLEGAEALVSAVDAAAGEGDVLFDLYGGVGLFGATVGARYGSVVSIERHGSAAADAVHNLRAHSNAASVAADVERWRPEPELLGRARRVVVADPARAGLGRRGVEAVLACEPERIVLVSCDAAALGRDAGLLAAGGYALRSAHLVDVFPHTAHVEVVSRFERVGDAMRGR